MRPIRRIALAALAVIAFAAPVTGAQASGGGDRSRATVVPAFGVEGNSAGALLGDWYVNNLSLPVGESPFEDGTSLCLDLGKGGRVLVPAGGVGPTMCTVTLGRHVVLAMTSAD